MSVGPERLEGRVVLVTGTASGIGLATASALVDAGAGCMRQTSVHRWQKSASVPTDSPRDCSRSINLTSPTQMQWRH